MIVVSHRGPVTFSMDATGGFDARPGAGGDGSALAPLLAKRDGTHWIAGPITPDDPAAIEAGAADVPEFDLTLLRLDPAVHRLHYDVVSNATLWFLFHGLFDLARRPRFDRRFGEAWEGYENVNRAFADAIAQVATEGEVVLVQDLQLMLVPGILASARPDLAVSHFSHTPFCGPGSIRVLPEHVARALCGSLSATHAGFHTPRWARAFEASAAEVLGRDTAQAYSASFGPDAQALAREMERPEVGAAIAQLEARIGDRALIVRSDRMEPSKNIVRGF